MAKSYDELVRLQQMARERGVSMRELGRRGGKVTAAKRKKAKELPKPVQTELKFETLYNQCYEEDLLEGTFTSALAKGALVASLAGSPLVHKTYTLDKPINIVHFITKHEDSRSKVYIDSRGYPTIGVGHNLAKPESRMLLKQLGLDYSKIVSGEQALNDEQIDFLLKKDLEEAYETAIAFANGKFYEHPQRVRAVLVDMAFNLGRTKLFKFEDMRAALNVYDYDTAAKEMVDSKWYHQVGRRSKELVKLMKSAAYD